MWKPVADPEVPVSVAKIVGLCALAFVVSALATALTMVLINPPLMGDGRSVSIFWALAFGLLFAEYGLMIFVVYSAVAIGAVVAYLSRQKGEHEV